MTTPSHTGLYKIIRENYNHESLISCCPVLRKDIPKNHHPETTPQFRSKIKTIRPDIPNAIRVRTLVDSYEGHRIAERASRQFLRARVTQNLHMIRHLETDVYFQRCQLELALHPGHLSALEELVNHVQSLEQRKV